MKSRSKSSKRKPKEAATNKNIPLHVNKGRSHFVVYLAIFVFPFLLYSNTLNHKYAFDDSIVITENKFTKQGIEGIPDLLRKDMFEGIYGQQLEVTGGRYRPLSLLTFALEYEFFGENPKAGHFFNVLLYCLLSLILFLCLKKITSNELISIVATLLFAAHPIHTEVVANIKSRDEILCFLFSLSSMYLFFRYRDTGQKDLRSVVILFSALLCFYLSLLAKETAVVFLILIPAALFLNKRSTILSVGIRSFIPLLALFIVYFMIRAKLVGLPGGSDSNDIMENPFVNSDIEEKFATISIILGKYLKLMFFPHPLSSDYSYNQIPLQNLGIGSILWMIIYGGILVFSILYIIRKKLLAFSGLLYLLPLSITSNIFFNIGAPMGERFAFISSAGFCLFISVLLFKYLGKNKKIYSPKKHWEISTIVLILLIFYSWITIDRNKDWKDNLTLFSADVETVPNSAKIHYYYGNTLQNRYVSGDRDKDKLLQAKKEFIKSLKINPDFHWAHFNLGKAYDYLNNPDSAIYHLQQVLKLNPTHIATQGVLGSVYGKHKQDYQKAIYYIKKGLEYGDINKSNYHNLAIAYVLSGENELAVTNFKEAIKYGPKDARLHFELGMTLQSMGREKEGQIYLNKAYQFDPSLKQ